MDSHRRVEGHSGNTSGRGRRWFAAGAATAAGLAGLVIGVGPGVGDMLNQAPAPATDSPVPTVVATRPQAKPAGIASASGTRKKHKRVKVVYKKKPAVLDARISTKPMVTEEGKGSFVGLKCSKHYKAVAGGVLSQYVNLLISSSSPNNPKTEKFTPNIWWLAVTNVNVDGQGGSLPWRGVVSCMKPIKLKHR